jgi:hypothetical protein
MFDPRLGDDLRAEIERGLEPVTGPIDALALAPLFLSKHNLNQVHGCEVRYLAERDNGFAGWTIPMARGTVAHRAIELSMHARGTPSPSELVDHALARLADDPGGLGEFLQSLPELDRADLRGQAVEQVCSFLESWPPLLPRWRPRSESKVRVDLCGERITLQGKVDLTVGFAEGTTAGKVLIDFKTGAFSPDHLHDLRFYALIETIARGVPPFRVATHYLERGAAGLLSEDITEATLSAAARRTIDAVTRAVELEAGANDPPPRVKTGASCRWCPALATCEAGQRHIAALDDW